MNNYLWIVMMLAFLSTTLASLKFTYGQSDRATVNHTDAYSDLLMDVIRNANITIPPDFHPTMKQLEKIAHEIVGGGHPNQIMDDIRQNKSRQLP